MQMPTSAKLNSVTGADITSFTRTLINRTNGSHFGVLQVRDDRTSSEAVKQYLQVIIYNILNIALY